jgi:ferredoxin
MTAPGPVAPVFHARIEPQGQVFDAPSDRPLLLAAADAGIDMPSSCRNGTCRTCISRLLRGAVSYRIEWPGLLAEEKQQGFILPCVAYPAGDMVLEQAAP